MHCIARNPVKRIWDSNRFLKVKLTSLASHVRIPRRAMHNRPWNSLFTFRKLIRNSSKKKCANCNESNWIPRAKKSFCLTKCKKDSIRGPSRFNKALMHVWSGERIEWMPFIAWLDICRWTYEKRIISILRVNRFSLKIIRKVNESLSG